MCNERQYCLRRGLLLFASPTVLCITIQICFAQANLPKVTPKERADAAASVNKYLGWLSAPWSDDDQQFVRLEHVVDEAIDSGVKPVDLIRKYEVAGKNNPHDAKAEFAYYSCLEGRRGQIRGYNGDRCSEQVWKNIVGYRKGMISPEIRSGLSSLSGSELGSTVFKTFRSTPARP